MRTHHAQHQPDNSEAPRRRILTTRTIVLAFAAVEAVMIGWMLFSGHIR